MKKLLILILLCGFGIAEADMHPTGHNEWRDGTTVRRRLGGEIQNYDSAGTWRPIQFNWVDEDSVFAIRRGRYTAVIDKATGSLRYSRKGHTIGLTPTRLIWFRPSDKRWTTIAVASRDSIVADGRHIEIHDPFGLGINIRYRYQGFSLNERFSFTQEARDTLKTLYQAMGDNTIWLGTVTRIDIDSATTSIRKRGNLFSGGEVDDDNIEFRGAVRSFFNIPSKVQESADSTAGSTHKVRRRIVKRNGRWFLVELVNPRRLKNGPFYHNATITDTLNVADTELRDSRLDQAGSAKAKNWGGSPNWLTGSGVAGEEHYTWFYFVLPGDISTVTACSLSLTKKEWSGSADSMHIVRMVTPIEPIYEGVQNGGVADSLEMSWDNRVDMGTGTDSAWGTAGAEHTTTDYANRVVGAIDLPCCGSGTVKGPIEASVIDSMVNHGYSNYGFKAMHNTHDVQSTRVRFASSEFSTEADRPFIILVYESVSASTDTRRRHILLRHILGSIDEDPIDEKSNFAKGIKSCVTPFAQ